MDPGHLIAVNVTLLYTIFGPLVLCAIYVLFDMLSMSKNPEDQRLDAAADKEDPALWTEEDIDAYMRRM